MSSEYADQRKRPPPIIIPPLPYPRPAPVPDPIKTTCGGTHQQPKQQQHDARNVATVMRQGLRSRGGSPSTSPLEEEASRRGSSRSKSRATFSDLKDQARVSLRKSDYGSTVTSQSSTTQSKHSRHSGRSAATMLHQLEVPDQSTNRGQMEARNEHKWFKMTGQLPPTPAMGIYYITILENENELTILGAVDEDVHIRTEDLRAQCRAINMEKQPDRDEPTKSPKKTLFGNLKHAFNRMPNNAPPLMPSKAAQVFGTAPRDPHKIEVRPIKLSEPVTTPVKLARSDTSKPLPEKPGNPHECARPHRNSTSRRSRSERQSLDRGNKGSVYAEETLPVPEVDVTFKPASPPTPPAKDTPLAHKPTTMPLSPLRRARPSERLRETFDAHVDRGMKLQFPEFALSPLPLKTALSEKAEMSLTKSQLYTTEEYAKVIKGEPLQWPHPELCGSSFQQKGSHSASPAMENVGALKVSPAVRRNDETCSKDPNSHHLSPPLPELDVSLDRSIFPFAESKPQSEHVGASSFLRRAY